MANGFANKSIGSYFLTVFMQVGMYVFFTILMLFIVRAKTLPGAADQRFRRAWLRFMFLMKVILILIFATTAVMTVTLATAPQPVSTGIVALTAVIVIVALVLSVRLGQGGARLAGDTGTASDRLDDRYWKLGVIYVNPDDPSLLVERRFGVGWTFNLGNPRGFLLLLAILAIPIGLALVSILATSH